MSRNLRIAVVTTEEVFFTKYCKTNGYDDTTAKQVKVLSDIKDEVFSDKIKVYGSENVTDYVFNNIRIKD